MEYNYPEFLKRFLPEARINKESLQVLSYENTIYYRLRKDISGFQRGTVFIEGTVVHGYHRIKRILNLQEGITRYIKGPFYIEEKMDGYNIRIRKIGTKVFAFTRGGFICPFTMDRLHEFIDTAFFDTYPDLTLCAEVVGPENPYNSEGVPYMDRDIQFYIFDIKDRLGRSLPIEKRYRIYKEASLNSVRRWGPFQKGDIEKIRDIVRELDAEQREGIVIKPVTQGPDLKYVTLGSCIRDIKATAHLMTEIPAGFYIQRILRLVMICREFDIPLTSEILADIGKALVLPLDESVSEVKKGEKIKEYFRIRVNKKETIDRMLRHLKKTGITAQIVSVNQEDGKFVVTFYRTFPKGTKILKRALKGYGIYD